MIAPEALRDRQQWLLWRFEPDPKKPEKPSKVPYYITGKRRVGQQGSPDDRQWLTNYQAALDALSWSKGHYSGIGFAFLPDDGLVGIDLDNMVDLDTGEIQPRALKIIEACGSYTERSPSGKGFHIFARGDTAALFNGKRQSFKNNAIGVEVFCGSQYFTFTGEHYSGTPTECGEIPIKVLKRLHVTVDKAKGKARAAASVSTIDNDFKRVNDAAIRNLDAWVPTLFPAAKKSPQGYRIASRDLGRDLEEDLSITPEGIKDFGVADMGDPREGGRTPIDLVIEWGSAKKPAEALHWLGAQLGIALGKPPRRGKGGAGNSVPPAGGRSDVQGEPPPEEGSLPLVRWRQGLLRQCVDEAEKALVASEERIYQRAGKLVRVIRRDTASLRNYRRDPGILGFQEVEKASLIEALTACARWEKWDGRSESWRRINAPEQAADTYLARAGRWRLPKLWSVISAPTLRPDGTVLQRPGYDEETATWYDPGEVAYPTVPERPTREDAERALQLLVEAFASFPFVSDADRSVFLAMLLTALVRRSMPHAPLGAFTAPTSSSGKTLLADLISIVATGIRAPAMKFPDADEEGPKVALSALMEGDPIILIDNVERPLQGDWLCTLLTSETYRGRLLGKSEMVSAPSASLWLATGNNLVLVGDLRTRALICRIDPQSEHPEQRGFADDIKQTMAKRRPEMVAAGLTVMRAFIATGQRVSDFVKPWGRFEAWTDLVRAPLVWLDRADPCQTIKSIEKDDPERADLLRMLIAWKLAFGADPATARKAVALASDVGLLTEGGKLLREVLGDIAMDRGGMLNVRKVGKWLSRHVERRAEGMRFVKDREEDHVQTYKVEVLTA